MPTKPVPYKMKFGVNLVSRKILNFQAAVILTTKSVVSILHISMNGGGCTGLLIKGKSSVCLVITSRLWRWTGSNDEMMTLLFQVDLMTGSTLPQAIGKYSATIAFACRFLVMDLMWRCNSFFFRFSRLKIFLCASFFSRLSHFILCFSSRSFHCLRGIVTFWIISASHRTYPPGFFLLWTVTGCTTGLLLMLSAVPSGFNMLEEYLLTRSS